MILPQIIILMSFKHKTKDKLFYLNIWLRTQSGRVTVIYRFLKSGQRKYLGMEEKKYR